MTIHIRSRKSDRYHEGNEENMQSVCQDLAAQGDLRGSFRDRNLEITEAVRRKMVDRCFVMETLNPVGSKLILIYHSLDRTQQAPALLSSMVIQQ